MNLQYETINFEVVENIAIIRLNRPNSYNSLNGMLDPNRRFQGLTFTKEFFDQRKRLLLETDFMKLLVKPM